MVRLVQSAREKPEVRNAMPRVVSGCCPLTVCYFYYSSLDLCSSLGTWLQRVHRTLAYGWKITEYFELAEFTEKLQLKLPMSTGKGVAQREPENKELKEPMLYTHIGILFLGFNRASSLLAAATGMVSKLTVLLTSHLMLYLFNNRYVK